MNNLPPEMIAAWKAAQETTNRILAAHLPHVWRAMAEAQRIAACTVPNQTVQAIPPEYLAAISAMLRQYTAAMNAMPAEYQQALVTSVASIDIPEDILTNPTQNTERLHEWRNKFETTLSDKERTAWYQLRHILIPAMEQYKVLGGSFMSCALYLVAQDPANLPVSMMLLFNLFVLCEIYQNNPGQTDNSSNDK